MSVIIVDDDILNFKYGAILHQVNCFEIKSGVANALAEKYKQVREAHTAQIDFYLKQHNREGLLGIAQKIRINRDLWVINIFGQYNYGYDGKKYTNYLALFTGLTNALSAIKYSDVAIPFKIGCDRGGADWNIVYTMIQALAIDFEHDIYLYRKDV